MRISGLLREKGEFVATITPDATVVQVLAELAEHGVGALVVTEDAKRILGIVSERDIARALHHDGTAALRCAVEATTRQRESVDEQCRR